MIAIIARDRLPVPRAQSGYPVQRRCVRHCESASVDQVKEGEIIEFAIVGVVFFLMILGAIDVDQANDLTRQRHHNGPGAGS
jgi:hypothetical protein